LLLDRAFPEREARPVPPNHRRRFASIRWSCRLGRHDRRALRQRSGDLGDAARGNYRWAEEVAGPVPTSTAPRRGAERAHPRQHEAAALAARGRAAQPGRGSAAPRSAPAERPARARDRRRTAAVPGEHERAMPRSPCCAARLRARRPARRVRHPAAGRTGAAARLRAELDRAEGRAIAGRRSLQRATENARPGRRRDIRSATAEQQLPMPVRPGFARRAGLGPDAGDGPLGRMTAQLQERDDKIARLEFGSRPDARESTPPRKRSTAALGRS